MLRQARKRLAHKQWLIFYPLALAIINTLAFLAVYSAAGGAFSLEHVLRDRTSSAGTSCATISSAASPSLRLSASPCSSVWPHACSRPCSERPISGRSPAPATRWPPGPGRRPAGSPSSTCSSTWWCWSCLWPPRRARRSTRSSPWWRLAIALLLVYADYVIVFEGLAFIPAVRRSVTLLSRRWRPVLLIFVVLQFVVLGLNRLYSRYYDSAEGVFLLVPLSEVLVWSFITLMVDVLLIFLYEQVRSSH